MGQQQNRGGGDLSGAFDFGRAIGRQNAPLKQLEQLLRRSGRAPSGLHQLLDLFEQRALLMNFRTCAHARQPSGPLENLG